MSVGDVIVTLIVVELVLPAMSATDTSIVWQAEHFARGAFYYENAVPETFFAEVT